MKPALLTCAFLTLFIGCAGSGGGGGNTLATVTPTPIGMGNISITLMAPATSSAGAVATTAEAVEPCSRSAADTAAYFADTTDIRFVVTNATNGFKSIQDIKIGTVTAVDIPVPIGEGYVLDVISSAAGFNFLHYMLKYGQTTNISVLKNATTNVSMVLQPITATITPPSTASEGDPITVGFTAPNPLTLAGFLNTSTSPFTGSITVGYNNPPSINGNSLTVNALTARDSNGNAVSGTEYFQGVFFINPAFTAAGASGSEWTTWAFTYPNSWRGDPNVSCPLTVPSGGIGVSVTY